MQNTSGETPYEMQNTSVKTPYEMQNTSVQFIHGVSVLLKRNYQNVQTCYDGFIVIFMRDY